MRKDKRRIPEGLYCYSYKKGKRVNRFEAFLIGLMLIPMLFLIAIVLVMMAFIAPIILVIYPESVKLNRRSKWIQ